MQAIACGVFAKDMGLTQIQFADRLGVSSITVHRWESGQSRPRRLALARLRELAGELAEQDTPAELPATARRGGHAFHSISPAIQKGSLP